jgi:uncharacterized membrane protein YagU involved in acid resistance
MSLTRDDGGELARGSYISSTVHVEFHCLFSCFYSLLCPEFVQHLVDTGMLDGLPIYLRISVKTMNVIRARPPQKAGWMALNAAICDIEKMQQADHI